MKRGKKTQGKEKTKKSQPTKQTIRLLKFLDFTDVFGMVQIGGQCLPPMQYHYLLSRS